MHDTAAKCMIATPRHPTPSLTSSRVCSCSAPIISRCLLYHPLTHLLRHSTQLRRAAAIAATVIAAATAAAAAAGLDYVAWWHNGRSMLVHMLLPMLVGLLVLHHVLQHLQCNYSTVQRHLQHALPGMLCVRGLRLRAEFCTLDWSHIDHHCIVTSAAASVTCHLPPILCPHLQRNFPAKTESHQ